MLKEYFKTKIRSVFWVNPIKYIKIYQLSKDTNIQYQSVKKYIQLVLLEDRKWLLGLRSVKDVMVLV